MSRILFVWELGGTYGRLAQMLGSARELANQGHQVAIAARELHNIASLLDDTRVEMYQSPVWLPNVNGLPEPPLNYAELLLRYGYHDAPSLSGLVKGWLGLFNNYWPGVVVCCHAPTALIAARIARLPAVAMGDGFAMPPAQSPMPNMCPWITVPAERLQSSEQIVLDTVNQLLKSCSTPPIAALRELFNVAENYLCTFPELDHYGPRDGAKYWGAGYRTDVGDTVEWPAGDSKRVFVYLKPESRHFAAIIQALTALGVPAIVSAPGISENDQVRLSNENVRVFPRLVRLRGLMENCQLSINTASTAMTAAMLHNGVPCLLLSERVEHLLLATRAQNTGATFLLNPEAQPPDFSKLLPRVLEDDALARNAARFAAVHAGFDPAAQCGEIAAGIAAIAGGH